jgi:lipoprotein-releasing system permease protein
MYQLLLCWRYLRTRWIALASIVSVTLGVATLIVVNSVMDGFTKEMHDRIHGILSDIVVQSHSTAGMGDPTPFVETIRKRLGDRLQGVTTIVTVPAMLTFSREGQSHTQQINLIGIDTDSYASVSDFSRFLMHPENRKQLEFLLREDGYAPDRESLQWSGWHYRRARADMERQAADLEARNRMLREQIASLNPPTTSQAPGDSTSGERASGERAVAAEFSAVDPTNPALRSPEETPLATPQELVPPSGRRSTHPRVRSIAGGRTLDCANHRQPGQLPLRPIQRRSRGTGSWSRHWQHSLQKRRGKGGGLFLHPPRR